MPTLVITTPAGQEELRKAGATKLGWLEIRALEAEAKRIDPLEMMRLLRSQFGVTSVLHEGGPTLFGQFLEAQALDELFLTTAPQIARQNRTHISPGTRSRYRVYAGQCAPV